MAATRFAWNSRTTEAEKVLELKSRNVVRSANPRDAKCRCVVKACHLGRIHEGDRIYSPTKNPSSDNVTAAHIECVDAYYATFMSASAEEAKQKAKGHLLIVPDVKGPAAAARPAVAKTPATLDVTATGSELIRQMQALREQIFEAGRQAGIAEAIKALTSAEDGDNGNDSPSSH